MRGASQIPINNLLKKKLSEFRDYLGLRTAKV